MEAKVANSPISQSDIESAAALGRIFLSYTDSGLVAGCVLWEPETDVGGETTIHCRILADASHRRRVILEFRRFCYQSLGKTRYHRSTESGQWREVEFVVDPDASEMTRRYMPVARLVEHVWGVDRLPGIIEPESKNVADAVARAREELIKTLAPKADGRYLEFGSGHGSLAVDICDLSPARVTSLHRYPHSLWFAAYHGRDREHLEVVQGDPCDLAADYRDYDGAIIMDLASISPSLATDLQAMASRLRRGGRLILVDHMAHQPNESLGGKTVPDAHGWHELWEKVGLRLISETDWTKHAVDTYSALSRQLMHLPDVADATAAKKWITSRLRNYQRKRFFWRVWELERAEPPADYNFDNAGAVAARPVTLVMMSGGLDSAYTLWKAVTANDHDVIAHHIHFVNAENRHLAESRACEKQVDWFKRQGYDIWYTESSVDRSNMQFFGFDMMTVGFEAGLAAQSYRYTHDRPVSYWQIGSCTEEGGWPRRWPHVLNSCQAASYPFPPPEYLELPLVSKRQQLEELPDGLTALTWGCRRPNSVGGEWWPCGNCRTCRTLAELKREP